MNRPLPHGTWLERVLGYESLPPATRLETDEHLRTCAECRVLRERLLTGEALAFATESVPDPLAEGALAGEALEGERASRAALLQRVPLPFPAPAHTAGNRRTRWIWASSVAAAAAVLVLVWPRPVSTPHAPIPLRGSIERVAEMRGAPASGWRTGDPFQLRLLLPQAGHLVVLVVDDSGQVSRLFPAEPEWTGDPFPPGVVLLPDSSRAESWSFTGAAGRETFLVTLTSEATPGPESIERTARAAAIDGDSRDSRLAAVVAALERVAAQVLRLDLVHEGPERDGDSAP